MSIANFYKADFHVHTLESHCFISTQETTEKEYIKLLKDAREIGPTD